MTNNKVEFGWVIQPAAMSTAEQPSLMADNQRFLELVRRDFQTVWFEDHFLDVGRYQHHGRLEGWTLLTYLLPQYPELRFGNLVLGLAYRNPALVAKMAATLQALSGGRLILGIGAGWHKPEYDAYGWTFPSPGVRVRQLDEYTQIIRLMLTQSPASFTGKYFSIANAYNDPLPNPPVPLMIGGSGEQGTLRTTAKYADWWNFGLRPVEDFAHKKEVLQKHCAEVGRHFDEIVLSAFHFVQLSGAQTSGVPTYTLGYDADSVTRQLEAFVQLGVRHFMLRFLDFPSTTGVESFLRKVLPRFQ
jgi:alkanesulfonate monooxygenase SsuD/methylene tetrahydromethanopterin reductase-like flavin-dependent oxidoreductase (luciferase family)